MVCNDFHSSLLLQQTTPEKKSLHVLSALELQRENTERMVQTEVALEVGMSK